MRPAFRHRRPALAQTKHNIARARSCLLGREQVTLLAYRENTPNTFFISRYIFQVLGPAPDLSHAGRRAASTKRREPC